ncbi:lactate dehydrogenase [Verrucomicrobia bacterium]|nr:lactate dehydrogenase [Verrucomicrobiota bacterium]
MNAVEIEQAASELVEAPFDAEEFPYAFLEAFGNKATTLKKLRSGTTNKSDLRGVLQRNNIHIKVCPSGTVGKALNELRGSLATAKGKVKIILATDGQNFEAEDLNSGETVACEYQKFPDHFGFFLPLAGISTVKQIRESSFDIKATGRLNRLYVQLLKDNPDWGSGEKREHMNHFMTRLIFCFFAEDTDIFKRSDLFTDTVDQMSESDASNIHEIIMELFRAMNTPFEKREAEKIARWANELPYVNGGLFAGSLEVPKFTRIARSFLLHIGGLDWKKINPDIFGSMIQAVADDEERGELGMHYTSVPNILKVLNPLFLDDLREQLKSSAGNGRKLLNLKNRLAKIRVFDPACGSGNFLVIAYKEMRAIEALINERRGESNNRSVIPLTNFRGIEIRDFSAEVARLALIIAEYQCDVLYRGQKDAIQDFLPLRVENWITCANALQIDWLSVCPSAGMGVQHRGDDLFFESDKTHEVDFENEGGETYICGNPPYSGSKRQSVEQKSDLAGIFDGCVDGWKSLDYVAGWFMKAADYALLTPSTVAFVATNSVCQGQQVPILWQAIFRAGQKIAFAHQNFKWANLARHKAGVTVVIVGLASRPKGLRQLFSVGPDDETISKSCDNINAYLIAGSDVFVESRKRHISGLPEMARGNGPTDGGHLLLDAEEVKMIDITVTDRDKFIKPFVGSRELINGILRYCIWIDDEAVQLANAIPDLKHRIENVRAFRLKSKKAATVKAANWSHRFDERKPLSGQPIVVVPVISSENRQYLPVDVLSGKTVVSNKVFSFSAKPLWPFAVICSAMNIAWVGAVCARMRTDFSYTNTLGWNTFPVPTLTEKNKADLTRCAENILLAREAHFPKTIADLYDPEKMPLNLREAHEQNDETLERIYIGRRFKNDTERLEKLFELYIKMTTSPKKAAKA